MFKRIEEENKKKNVLAIIIIHLRFCSLAHRDEKWFLSGVSKRKRQFNLTNRYCSTTLLHVCIELSCFFFFFLCWIWNDKTANISRVACGSCTWTFYTAPGGLFAFWSVLAIIYRQYLTKQREITCQLSSRKSSRSIYL